MSLPRNIIASLGRAAAPERLVASEQKDFDIRANLKDAGATRRAMAKGAQRIVTQDPLFGMFPARRVDVVVPLTDNLVVEGVSPGNQIEIDGFDPIRYLSDRVGDYPAHLTAAATEAGGAATPALAPVARAGLVHALLVKIQFDPDAPGVMSGILTITRAIQLLEGFQNLDTEAAGVYAAGTAPAAVETLNFSAGRGGVAGFLMFLVNRPAGTHNVVPTPSFVSTTGAGVGAVGAARTISCAFTNLAVGSGVQFTVSALSPANPEWPIAVRALLDGYYLPLVG